MQFFRNSILFITTTVTEFYDFSFAVSKTSINLEFKMPHENIKKLMFKYNVVNCNEPNFQ